MNQMKITKEIKSQQLTVHLSFQQSIDCKKEYALVVLCSICAYFMQNKIDAKTNGVDTIYIDDVEVASLQGLDQQINIEFYIDKIKTYMKNANATLMFIGLQTYFNIYFHLYHTNEYKQIEEFYQKVKK